MAKFLSSLFKDEGNGNGAPSGLIPDNGDLLDPAMLISEQRLARGVALLRGVDPAGYSFSELPDEGMLIPPLSDKTRSHFPVAQAAVEKCLYVEASNILVNIKAIADMVPSDADLENPAVQGLALIFGRSLARMQEITPAGFSMSASLGTIAAIDQYICRFKIQGFLHSRLCHRKVRSGLIGQRRD